MTEPRASAMDSNAPRTTVRRSAWRTGAKTPKPGYLGYHAHLLLAGDDLFSPAGRMLAGRPYWPTRIFSHAAGRTVPH